MRVLFFLRSDVDRIPGGDAVEARVLADALIAVGHRVGVASSLGTASILGVIARLNPS